MNLSIIIPALNEADTLGRTLSSLTPAAHEILVVDGGSSDGTGEIALEHGAKLVVSRRGRGIQQDKGARQAKGEVFLFLHADTLLPNGFDDLVKDVLKDPKVALGAFQLGFDPTNAWLNVVACMANIRSRALLLPYGDQGLFTGRSDYFRVGGFAHLPIMEDVDLVKKLTRIGKFRLARGKVKTSPRRWQKEGMAYTTLRNWSIIIGYFMGVSPERLWRHYSEMRRL